MPVPKTFGMAIEPYTLTEGTPQVLWHLQPTDEEFSLAEFGVSFYPMPAGNPSTIYVELMQMAHAPNSSATSAALINCPNTGNTPQTGVYFLPTYVNVAGAVIKSWYLTSTNGPLDRKWRPGWQPVGDYNNFLPGPLAAIALRATLLTSQPEGDAVNVASYFEFAE